MTTHLLLIRHGETAWNAERRLQGHLDIALNTEGLRQAAALGTGLADEQIDAVISSDLQRAQQTALALACGRGLAVGVDPMLRERCYGGFEGLLYAEIEQRFPAQFAAWQARDIDSVMPAGARVAESFRQFFDRCTSAILTHAARHPGQTVALVAHGGVLECAYRAALGLSLESPRNFPVMNASINRFSVSDGKLALVQWGDVAHLQRDALDEPG